MTPRRTAHHLHVCPACERDTDHWDPGCKAPLAHPCTRCWAALRAWERAYAARGLVPPRVEWEAAECTPS